MKTLKATSVLVVVAVAGCTGNANTAPVSTTENVLLVRVVDGDTVRVSAPDGTDLGRVRLVGFDASEMGNTSQRWAPEATEHLITLLPDPGQEITLRRHGEDRDRYGRFLLLVEVDGRDVGLTMVESGAARAVRQSPPEYQAAASAARGEDRGLWGHCPGAADTTTWDTP